MSRARIDILEPGLMTSVQDAGRWGHQRFGVPVCGVRDQIARRFANTLVGNRPNTALLEANMLGPRFKVLDAPTLIAIAGSDQAKLMVGDVAVPPLQSVLVYPGEEVSVTPWGDSACVSIAFGGGVDVPLVLGSASTYMRGGFGGFQGRKLETGDQLTLGPTTDHTERWCQQPLPYGDGPLPIVLGPQHDHFPQETLATLTQGDYVVTNDCDRMGTRFDGQPLHHVGDFNIVSDAMAAGSVQIPGGKTPIIMGPDRGTVGGYTKIGTIATVAMSRFGRLKPRDRVRFVMTSAHEALADLRAKEADIRRMLMWIQAHKARS